MEHINELIELLDLEAIEDNLFRGQSTSIGSPRVFGGQVLAQALNAAIRTVDSERWPHSLHAYFILPGDISRPIVYDVERTRDGGSFTTRRIKAIQKGKVIFNMAVSFQKKEEGYTHQIQMPKVPAAEGLLTREELAEKYKNEWPEHFKRFNQIKRPIDFRSVDPFNPANPGKQDPYREVWMKSKGDIPDDPSLHFCILAYASDYNLLGTAILPHGDQASFANTQMASLDHAMWFHRDFRMDQWLLYSLDSPSTSNARGLCRGSIFDSQGNLVVSVVQEGLIRPWKAK